LKIKINPFDKGNPMTLGDAALLATVIAFVLWVTGFFANAQWEIIQIDVAQWCFDALKNYIVEWASVFFTLAGLEQLIQRGEE